MFEITERKQTNEVSQQYTHDIQSLFIKYVNYIDATPKTIETYTKALKQFRNYIVMNDIKSPTREDVIAFRQVLEQNHKATTVQTYLIAVRQFFKWTEQENLYPNIADNVKGKKISKAPKKDYLSTNAIKAILDTADRTTLKGIRDYAIITLMLTCGLRDIEVTRANIEDLRTLGENSVLYLQGKGRDEKADYVILPTHTEKAIRTYLAACTHKEESEPLFSSISNNSNGNRLTTRSVSRVVKEAMRKAGYDSSRLTAHSLRHTAITLSLKNGESLQEVQQFARHTNINTTLIYAHNLEKENNSCSNTVAKSIFND